MNEWSRKRVFVVILSLICYEFRTAILRNKNLDDMN